jgi:putative endonuclease
MSYYVYILKSQKDSTFYKGSSERPAERLIEHNKGESRYTKDKIPWDLVYVEELPNKREMLIREHKLKRGNKDFFERLIQSPKNIVQQFISNMYTALSRSLQP